MKQLMLGCDYLRGSSPRPLESLCMLTETARLEWGMYSYNRQVEFGNGCSVLWHDAKPEMRNCVQLTGQGMNTLKMAGFSLADIVEFYAQERLRASRIDIALDWFPGEYLDMRELESAYDGGAKTSAKTHSLIASKARKEEKAQSFYLGSRSSTAFIRIYDKGAERGLGAKELWRLELVLSGKRAAFAFNALAETPQEADSRLKALLLAEIGRIIPAPPTEWLKELISRLGTEKINILIARNDPAPENFATKVILPFLRNSARLLTHETLNDIADECLRELGK